MALCRELSLTLPKEFFRGLLPEPEWANNSSSALAALLPIPELLGISRAVFQMM